MKNNIFFKPAVRKTIFRRERGSFGGTYIVLHFVFYVFKIFNVFRLSPPRAVQVLSNAAFTTIIFIKKTKFSQPVNLTVKIKKNNFPRKPPLRLNITYIYIIMKFVINVQSFVILIFYIYMYIYTYIFIYNI